MACAYDIEGGIDFYAELAGEEDDSEETGGKNADVCTLTGCPLDDNHVALGCGHRFNYPAMFHEAAAQKAHQSSYGQDTVRLSLGEIKCPYCRRVNAGLLPYRPMPGFAKHTRGVNSPLHLCMPSQQCEWRLRGGASKGKACGAPAYTDQLGTHCPRHRKTVRLSKSSCALDSLTVRELKERLRELNLHVSGTKNILVARLDAHYMGNDKQ